MTEQIQLSDLYFILAFCLFVLMIFCEFPDE
jgi:hypothetical protein